MLVVFLRAPSPHFFSIVFTASALGICGSILYVICDGGTSPITYPVVMVGFWLLVSMAVGVSSKADFSLYAQQSPSLAAAHLALLYAGQLVSVLLNHVAAPGMERTRLVLSVGVLVVSLMGAFFLLGRQSALSEAIAKSSGSAGAAELIASQYGLTPREQEIMAYISKGNSAKKIADLMGLSPNTVKSYRTSLYAKLGIHSRQELIDLYAERLP